jgi:hypothetical protein
MRLIWVKRKTENFSMGDWTDGIRLIALTFLTLCRASQILGEGAI